MRINELLALVRESPLSSFYRDHWRGVRAFADLPHISRADFLHTPLSKRRYKNEGGLVKIVHDTHGAFLSEWSFGDIGKEEWGSHSKRPMVYMDDLHEAIEKSMWCRERGMIPLIAETTPQVAVLSASKYRIDSLVTDMKSLKDFLPYLAAQSTPLSAITVIGEHFDPRELAPFARFARHMRLVLALPETGGIGESEISRLPLFSPQADCMIECESGRMVLTKARFLVTPIIRYRTHLSIESEGDPSSDFLLVAS